jgi:hypothetical protein
VARRHGAGDFGIEPCVAATFCSEYESHPARLAEHTIGKEPYLRSELYARLKSGATRLQADPRRSPAPSGPIAAGRLFLVDNQPG